MNVEFYPGLDLETVRAVQAAEGPNELGIESRRTLLHIAFEVVREPMFLLLLGAGAIYLAMGNARDAVVLLGFVVVIMGVTIAQERRTERTLEVLKDMSSPRALAIRGGVPVRIAGREVVRGDILVLSEGDRVPADGEVLQAHELAVDESLLTGESVPVAKFQAAASTAAAVNDNAVYAGTLVVRGQALVQVSAIGGRTEMGRIGRSLSTLTVEPSPLRSQMANLTQRLAIIGILFSGGLTFLFVWLRGGWLKGMLAGIALAMSLLPQEFPVILIIFLALGARRMAQHRVLTRRLNAIETLGEATVLCVDKTGTLTQNRMAVAALCVKGQTLRIDRLKPDDDLPEMFHALLEFAVLASETEPHDPMELAFHRFAREYLANTEHLHPDWSLVREYELSPELPAMSHLWQQSEKGLPAVVAAKGAPEAVADLCHLSQSERQIVSEEAGRLADQGLRVLGVAKAIHHPSNWPDIQHDFGFEWIGLVALADPLRPEVAQAVAHCRNAGIRVVMITGDHPRTAKAIARAAGIAHEVIVTGAELEGLELGLLYGRIRSACVFARVSPAQKLAIVNGFKAGGEVVAMTGDGVNDAPALKSAHIGIAMGKRGTDVAREAASLVLLEDDFAAIVSAIELGRRIFSNLRQALIYTLAVHVPIIGLSLLPLLFGMPLMLTPIHIAFLELVIDPACSIVFEAEGGHARLMAAPPRPSGEWVVASRHVILSVMLGALVTLAAVSVYGYALANRLGAEAARSMAFTTLVSADMALILVNRSSRSGFSRMFRSIPSVGLWVMGVTMAALLLVTEVAPLARAFEFQPLDAGPWVIAFLVGWGTLLPFEGVKRVVVKLSQAHS
jgi:Ca2+-transporting ATPase